MPAASQPANNRAAKHIERMLFECSALSWICCKAQSIGLVFKQYFDKKLAHRRHTFCSVVEATTEEKSRWFRGNSSS
jgi:hypothetical protein